MKERGEDVEPVEAFGEDVGDHVVDEEGQVEVAKNLDHAKGRLKGQHVVVVRSQQVVARPDQLGDLRCVLRFEEHLVVGHHNFEQ